MIQCCFTDNVIRQENRKSRKQHTWDNTNPLSDVKNKTKRSTVRGNKRKSRKKKSSNGRWKNEQTLGVEMTANPIMNMGQGDGGKSSNNVSLMDILEKKNNPLRFQDAISRGRRMSQSKKNMSFRQQKRKEWQQKQNRNRRNSSIV